MMAYVRYAMWRDESKNNLKSSWFQTELYWASDSGAEGNREEEEEII